ncbi:DUF2834 domain-containing protein [Aquirufa ecclesiirivi]|uniref:DUF2834 domain-containing protein n=1 Tax=Aquirufa ecclesiirivi TaxID=2715124 RepID=UPI00140D31BE|nr:DUF2834 domain-containing protein [Aquirufa ecclesiirivi]MDF0692772.1 DUF2834 domain-containing protein [Aquirufa ecclesiirivi]NHC47875.1 DUF2834 domain-containing protein [Aquirufa ecclesiirivi]
MKPLPTNIAYFYLFLSIVGGSLTFYFVWLGMQEQNGNFDVVQFVQSTWTSYYAKSLTFDFWTGTMAGTFFMIVEGYRLHMKKVWLYILFTFLIGYAFAFPLFLFFRHKKITPPLVS